MLVNEERDDSLKPGPLGREEVDDSSASCSRLAQITFHSAAVRLIGGASLVGATLFDRKQQQSTFIMRFSEDG